jgi:hypothetical protein
MKRIVGLENVHGASLQRYNTKVVSEDNIKTIPSVKRQSSLPLYLLRRANDEKEEAELLD